MRFDFGVAIKIRDAYAARHEPEAERVLATLYWIFLVGFAACVGIGVILYGAWEFTRPLTDDVEPSVSVGARKTLSRTDIIHVLEALDARAQRFEDRLAEPMPRDPS